MNKEIEIKVGDVWEDGLGKRVTILEICEGDLLYPIKTDKGATYTTGGRRSISCLDLSRLISRAESDQKTVPEDKPLPAQSSLTIEVGKFYKRCDGRKAHCREIDDEGDLKIICGGHNYWVKPSGHVYGGQMGGEQPEGADLVEEWPEEQTPNTTQVGGSHYKDLAIQPWDAMQAWLTPEGFQGFLHGNVLNYTARAFDKGQHLEDLKEARHYLDKLIETLEKA